MLAIDLHELTECMIIDYLIFAPTYIRAHWLCKDHSKPVKHGSLILTLLTGSIDKSNATLKSQNRGV